MDNNFLGFMATQFELEYKGRVQECAFAVKDGVDIDKALSIYDIEYRDIVEFLKNF